MYSMCASRVTRQMSSRYSHSRQTLSSMSCVTFPRDGNIDYRTIPNVTFTVCNPHEFHDLASLPTQVMALRNTPIIYMHPVYGAGEGWRLVGAIV